LGLGLGLGSRTDSGANLLSGILSMAAKWGPNVVFCMSNRTRCILSVSVMKAVVPDTRVLMDEHLVWAINACAVMFITTFFGACAVIFIIASFGLGDRRLCRDVH
jgi:hypothetical protein